jgi:hypothetical protein
MRQREMEELHKAHARHATEDESVGRVRNKEELRLAVGVCSSVYWFVFGSLQQSGSLAWRVARGETGKQ